VPGHWEGNLIFGKGMSAIATLVERKTRFVMLIQLPNGHTADVVADARRQDRRAPRPAATFHHVGPGQMAQHVRFSIATGVPVYFCDPRSPW
jgi:IS30 family transposase